MLAMLVLPLSSMAMKAMDDKALEGVSGQAGVSIAVDITMNIHIDCIAWGDSDGLAPGPFNPWNVSTTGGYVGATNVSLTGLYLSLRGASVSPNSVSLWPDSGTITIIDGVPYYQVDASPLNQ